MNRAKLQLINFYIILLLVAFAAPSWAALSVQTRDSDGQNVDVEWRRIDFRLVNDGPTDVDMAAVTLEYIIADDSVEGLMSSVWHYNVHAMDWSSSGGGTGEVHVNFLKVGENVSVAMTFESRFLPVNGEATIQIGIQYSNWMTVDEQNDMSYLNSMDYSDNNNVLINGEGGTHAFSGFKKVFFGNGTSCGIRKSDSRAQCWGDNRYGEARPPIDVQFSDISIEFSHGCGIEAQTGLAHCWGDNKYGQAEPPTQTAFRQLAVGGHFTCGIRQDNDELECWGLGLGPDGTQGVTQESWEAHGFIHSIPEGYTYDVIDATLTTVCGIRSDTKTVACAGNPSYGQLSAPSTLEFKSIDAGVLHFCGIASNDEAVCWGLSDDGQTIPPTGVKLSEVAVAREFSCGVVSATDQVMCWGDTYMGGPNPFGDEKLMNLSVNMYSICGNFKSDGSIECVSDNVWGHTLIPDDAELLDISMGSSAVCAIQAVDDRLRCWNTWSFVDTTSGTFEKVFDGICGIRSNDHTLHCWTRGAPSPGELSSPETAYDKVSTMNLYGCALRSDNGLPECWGNAFHGETDPPAGVAFVDIGIGHGISCGIRADNGFVECWGNHPNSAGMPPTEVQFVRFTKLIADQFNGSIFCGIREDNNEAMCWGHQQFVNGQLDVPTGVAFFDLAMGSTSVCGLRVSDGQPQCWGWSTHGETTPPNVEMMTISGDGASYCGIRTDDGTIVCWGDTYHGRW